MFPNEPEVAVLPSKTKVPGTHEGVGVALVLVGRWRRCRGRRWCWCRRWAVRASESSLCSLNVSSGVVSVTLAAMTIVLPTLPAFKSAQRDEVRVVSLSPGAEAGQERVTQGVVIDGRVVVVPIQIAISLSPL